MEYLALNEQYFGKTPEVLKIEQAIGNLRRKYIKQYDNTEIFDDPKRFKLNEAIEDAFGFGVVDVQFSLTKQINACTIPIGLALDESPAKELKLDTKKGFKYNKSADYAVIIIITTGLFCNPEFTDGEVTAILLHEVGHNFSGATLPTVGVMSTLKSVIAAISSIGASLLVTANLGKQVNINFDRFLRAKAKNLTKIFDMIGLIYNKIQDLLYEGYSVQKIMVLLNPINAILLAIYSVARYFTSNILFFIPNMIAGYNDERFADSFAAMYGYGPELHEALVKLDNTTLFSVDAMVKNCPVLSNYMDLALLPTLFIIRAFDEHPEIPARLHNTCKQIESDLNNKRYSPEMKARIKHDLAVMQKSVKRYEKINDDIAENPNSIKESYYKWLSSFGGDLKHNLYTAASPDSIANIFTAKLKNKK